MGQGFEECAELVAAKKYKEAIALYNKLIDRDPVRALNNCSACHYAQKEYQVALDVAKRALKVDPKHPQSHFRAAMAYEGMMHYEEALWHLQEALSIQPRDEKYKEAASRIEAQMRAGHGIGSEETKKSFYYEKSVKNGVSAMKEGNFDEAIRQFSKAIDLFPHGPADEMGRELSVLYANRSAGYFKKLDFWNSAEDALKSCEMDRTYGRGFFRLACAREKQHEYEAAVDAANACLALDPSHEEAKGVRDRCTPYAERSRKGARERAAEEHAELRVLADEREKGVAMECGAGLLKGGKRKPGRISYVCCTYCNDVGHQRSECPLLRSKRRKFDGVGGKDLGGDSGESGGEVTV